MQPSSAPRCTASSSMRDEVDFIADEYAPFDPDAPPQSATRPHVNVCTGCL